MTIEEFETDETVRQSGAVIRRRSGRCTAGVSITVITLVSATLWIGIYYSVVLASAFLP